jgi:LmbE family N-acetylglucosaminyl deacetylase
MSAFGILTKKILPGELILLTVFSWSNYIVLNRRTVEDLRTLLNFVPRPGEFADSLARNVGRLGTNPISVLRKLFDLREPYKVSRIRLLEDLAFTKRTGMRFGYFNFPDSKIRHGRPIMDASWPLTGEQDVLTSLSSALQRAVSRMQVQVILAPWPYGPRQHVDHRLVSLAASRVADETGTRLLYLDDQPYARRPLETMQDYRGHSYVPLLVKLDHSDMERKYGAMNLYRSQMIPSYFQAVRRAPPGSIGEPNSETLWQPLPGIG